MDNQTKLFHDKLISWRDDYEDLLEIKRDKLSYYEYCLLRQGEQFKDKLGDKI